MQRECLRLGIVPYLNVLPLLEGLDAACPRDGWGFATPRVLGEWMRQGQIDLATLPVFEALGLPGCRFVPDCAIACHGPVRSVRLVSRQPLNAIQSLVIDRSSMTSAHLGRILLRQRYGVDPQVSLSPRPLSADDSLETLGCQAALVIGDAALAWENRPGYAMDLGLEWLQMTGLPFVFAAWIAAPGASLAPQDIAALIRARQQGERNAEAIARREADARAMPADSLVQYLTCAIRYRLGDPEKKAIELFRQMLIRHQFLDPGCPPAQFLPAPLIPE